MKVLVTKRVFPEAVSLLRAKFDVDYAGTDVGLTPAELARRSHGADGIVSQLTDKFDPALITTLDGVKVLANVAVGFDNIDLAAATAKGIAVTNTPGVLTETTADFAWTLLMAAARRLTEAHAFLHSGQWQRWTIDLFAGQDIWGKTLGIFGLGRIGQAVARRAHGFGMTILYHDPQPVDPAVEQTLGARFVPKFDLLRSADFVSLHVPLTPATHHLIGAAELAAMKPTAVLVNTARGAVVDEAALADSLQTGGIAAAGLDVFENEPNVNPRLLSLTNAVLAPHIASASVDTRRRMSLIAAENCAAALEGRRPANLLNPDVWR